MKAEVIDLRTLMPLDIDTIVDSIKKTNRAIVVQEAQSTAGIAAEVIAQINEKAILHLEAPVLRVAPPDTVYPFAQIEDAVAAESGEDRSRYQSSARFLIRTSEYRGR